MGNIHDQAAFADLLYRSPAWCLELLGLTGEPRALSILPLSRRPTLESSLIGRETDLGWLAEGRSDCLVIGQPGAGKTHLLQEYARGHDGLFVVSGDRTQIAREIRQERPKAIILDDAQSRLDWLVTLRHLRGEVRGTFRIICAAWPGAEPAIRQAMGLSSEETRRLEDLTGDEIVSVVKAVGLLGPDWLLQEIVNQANGQPGLAVTLAWLCRRGEVRRVVAGDALFEDRRVQLEGLVGLEVMSVLAAFAVGGRVGLPLHSVAAHLQVPPARVSRLVEDVAAAGVIEDVGEDSLAVRPRPLRHVLVRQAYFAGSRSLSLDSLRNAVRDPDALVETLIGVRARGGAVENELLVGLLEQLDSWERWKEFAWLGPDEAALVLERNRRNPEYFAEPLLDHLGARAIEALLEGATLPESPLSSLPGHRLRKLFDWVQGGRSQGQEASRRRRQLLDLVGQHARDYDPQVVTAGLGVALSPQYKGVRSAPGSGLTRIYEFGVLPGLELHAIALTWPTVARTLSVLPDVTWTPIQQTIYEWLAPRSGGGEVPAWLEQAMNDVGRMMVANLSAQTWIPLGLRGWLSEAAINFDIELQLAVDAEYDVLYPAERREAVTDTERLEALARRAEALGVAWAEAGADSVVPRLLRYEAEARRSAKSWPAFLGYAIASAARSSPDPLTWAKALVREGASPGHVVVFLRASRPDDRLVAFLQACLGWPKYEVAAVSTIISAQEPITDLIETVLGLVPGFRLVVHDHSLRGEIAPALLERLFTHPDRSVATAAASGWYYRHGATERPSAACYQALLDGDGESEWLGHVFKGASDFAADWILARSASSDPHALWSARRAVADAVAHLSPEDRTRVIEGLPDDFDDWDTVRQVVGDDSRAFNALLGRPGLTGVHLAPLGDHAPDVWLGMVTTALDAGYSPEQVAAASHFPSSGWVEQLHAELEQWVPFLAGLHEHNDDRVREVARLGSVRVAAELEAYRARYRRRRQRLD